MSKVARETMLARIRQAVAEGNRAGEHALPERGDCGYQGPRTDLVKYFEEQCTGVGGYVHRALSDDELGDCIAQLVQTANGAKVLLGRGEFLDKIDLQSKLSANGVEVLMADEASVATNREAIFGADVGITGVEFAIAETGTLVVAAKPNELRTVSLLPPFHIAVIHESQIVPDLYDVTDGLATCDGIPSNVTLITGPSKTGDIELRLVTGVHGPKEVHVVLRLDR